MFFLIEKEKSAWKPSDRKLHRSACLFRHHQLSPCFGIAPHSALYCLFHTVPADTLYMKETGKSGVHRFRCKVVISDAPAPFFPTFPNPSAAGRADWPGSAAQSPDSLRRRICLRTDRHALPRCRSRFSLSHAMPQFRMSSQKKYVPSGLRVLIIGSRVRKKSSA